VSLHPEFSIEENVPVFKHGSYRYVVNLLEPFMGCEGRVGLKLIDVGLLETHSSLDEELQGQGLGIQMYAKAIALAHEKGFDVCSATHKERYYPATRLWYSKRLNEMFRIERDGERFWVRKFA
jgi:hypothetical protein